MITQLSSHSKPSLVRRMSLPAVTKSASPWSCSAMGLMTVEMVQMNRAAQKVSGSYYESIERQMF